MKATYRVVVWIEEDLEQRLDADHILARVGNAIRNIGDKDVHVACEPIRTDHAR